MRTRFVRSGVALRRGVRPAGEPAESDSLGEVGELLGRVTLDQDVPVVQGIEIYFDDICVGVVDPHVYEAMGRY